MSRKLLTLPSAILLAGLMGCDPDIEGRSITAGEQQATPAESKSEQVHRLIDYEAARKVFWGKLYSGEVVSIYCSERFHARQRRGFNIEHVFPMSWVSNGLQCGKRKQCRQRSKRFNLIEADLHNLYPSREDINRARSSFRFGIIGGERRRFGACDFEVDERARAVEPSDAVRGDLARSMFYMAHRYQKDGLKLFKKQAKLLIQWHRADSPSRQEVQRNAQIEQIQGNRNPFIDDPKLLENLYEQGFFDR